MKKRTQFNQRQTEMTDEELGIQMAEINLSELSDNAADNQTKKKKKKKKKKGRGGGDGGSGTAFHGDDTSLGFDIYDTSQDVEIEPLPTYTNPSNLEAAGFPSPPVHKRARSTFRKHQSEEGYTYYEDTESGETVWDLPDGGEVVEV